MKFILKVPPKEITSWADRYDYDDSLAEAIGRRVRETSVMTHEDFLKLSEWKTPRSKSRCQKNSAEYVAEVTRQALLATEPRFKIEVLRILDGVDWATASVLLHFCDRGQWPILDVRAFWSLSQTVPAPISYMVWEAYTVHTRALSARHNVSMRTLDRALWAYSKARQGKLGSR